jgi:deazaflavin-dependent oxidoreductase (nitroreductase family)
MSNKLAELKNEDYCYFTTVGRVTGNPHEIEIWFGLNNSTLYLMSGDGQSDWVKNLRKNPAVKVRIAKQNFNATARIVEDEAEQILARNLLADKYNERRANGTLSKWARTALVVGIDVIPKI